MRCGGNGVSANRPQAGGPVRIKRARGILASKLVKNTAGGVLDVISSGLRGVERYEAPRAPLPAGKAEYCSDDQAAGIGMCQGFDWVWGRPITEIGCSLNEFLPEGINAKGIGVRSGLR